MEKPLPVSNEADTESNGNVNSGGTPKIDPIVEKSLVRRMDFILLPTLCKAIHCKTLNFANWRSALVYLTHSLDRANLGNAKSATLEQDLGLVGNQYSLLLIVFYIPYSLFGIPATVLANWYSSALVIPLLVLGWGSLAMIQAATKNFGGIMACRVILGTMEAGFLPCAIFYLSTFYTRTELAKRLSVFFLMGFIAVSPPLLTQSRYWLIAKRVLLAASYPGACFNGTVLSKAGNTFFSSKAQSASASPSSLSSLYHTASRNHAISIQLKNNVPLYASNTTPKQSSISKTASSCSGTGKYGPLPSAGYCTVLGRRVHPISYL